MVIHIVKKGESLYTIAKMYGVNYVKIAELNGISLDRPLAIGQTIIVNVGNTEKMGTIEVNGYVLPEINMDYIKDIMPSLTYLSIYSCSVDSEGNISTSDVSHLVKVCKEYNVFPVLVVTNMEAFSFNPDISHMIVSDPKVYDNFMRNILKYIRENEFAGLCIDFENMNMSDKDAFNAFFEKVKIALHHEGFFITIDLPPVWQNATSYIDINYIGTIADFMTVQGYMRGGSCKPPAPVSPVSDMKKVLEFTQTETNMKNVLIGLANYGYQWETPYIQGNCAKTISSYHAIELAREHKAEIVFDNASLSPFFTYYTEGNQRHDVWFEDVRSMRAKLSLIPIYHLAGISIWTINWRFPQFYSLLNSMFNISKG